MNYRLTKGSHIVASFWLKNKTRFCLMALRKLINDGKNKLTAAERLQAIQLYSDLIKMGPTPPPIDRAVVAAGAETREKVRHLINRATTGRTVPEEYRWLGCPHDPSATKGCEICQRKEKAQ